jgi:hypothetical protein
MTAFAAERPSAAPWAAVRSHRPACAEAPQPATERGWFESSRELRDGLTVIELDAPALAAAFAAARLQ